MGDEVGARKILAETMLANLYIIPKLLDQEIAEYDIWHPSSDGYIGYADYIPKEVIASITEAETQWLRQQYDSLEFRRILKRYIEIYRKLKNTKEIGERSRLLGESYLLLDALNQECT